MSELKIDRIHHVAYRCIDAKETVLWYQKKLNMDFVLAIAEDQVPSTKAPDPYMHVFLDAGRATSLPSSNCRASRRWAATATRPAWVQHLALKVEDRRTRSSTKQHLEATGVEVLGVDRPRRFQVDLLLRPERPPRRTGCPDPDTPEMMKQARRGEVGHARGVGARPSARPSTRPACTSSIAQPVRPP